MTTSNSTAASPRKMAEVETLRAIVEGTATATGQEFFKELVRNLGLAMDVQYAFVAEFAGHMRARTLGYLKPQGLVDTVEWDLVGTPCEEVVNGKLCHHPTGVKERFPQDEVLVEWGIESYLGVPLIGRDGKHLGHLAVFDPRPMPEEPQRLQIFQIFASRAAAELERIRYERAISQNERQFRDLYEEAPIAYVHEGTDSRFISANKAALRLLGVKPHEVEGTYGLDLCAPTPENKAAIENAFKATAEGRDQTLPILELRRKDNGKPLWVRWWSRPDMDGKTTRTMFIDITEQVLMEREKNRLQQQNQYLQEEIKSFHNFEEIVGRSNSLGRSLGLVRQVAGTDSTVLITGETGTGKELFARAIHSSSTRRDKPLIKVNCAALPSGLVESELFGHEKGAFSGAIARRIGRFELAHGGTIFLDEIGEMPLDVQAKLLRVLQEREFERVGSGTPIKCDVRVIAATNRDLLKAVREKAFREDLYYRLNVFPLHLPPLRERKEDIPLLVEFLTNRATARIGRRLESVNKDTLDRLLQYPWPGNIRELENIVERAVILSNGPELNISADILPHSAPVPPAATNESQTNSTLETIERTHILETLQLAQWVIEGPTGAAARLGLHPNTLRGRLKKLGIVRPTA